MVFSSAIFLFIFLPCCLAAYYLLGDRFKNAYLCLLSLFFYSWGEPKNIVWLLISILVNYILARGIDKSRDINKVFLMKAAMLTAVVFNLSLLFIFKYLNFAIKNVNRLFSTDYEIMEIALPIGISFFIFKSLSYIIDTYKGKIKAEKNIINLGLYISFFPQLLAGPITRFEDFGPQIINRSISMDKFHLGIVRFMIGFSKKVLLSDQLVDTVAIIFGNDGYSAPTAWLGAIAYTLEIYFDFSGYSDMAIGLGLMFGFETKENFNLPYIADSIQDFWRRWHISLSTWFKDYVYIPLGGSRCSKVRVNLNIAIVFFLTGLWHGASWNYIAWGMFYVVFMIIERAGIKDVLLKIPSLFRHIYSLIVIIIGWVFFRADNLHAAIRYIRNLFTITPRSFADLASVYDRQLIVFLILGIVLSSKGVIWIKKILSAKTLIYNICVIIVFLISIGYVWGSGFSPFLYLKF